MGEGSWKVQTSNYKINKPCGYNLQHGDQLFFFLKKDGNLITRDTLHDLLEILLFLQIRVSFQGSLKKKNLILKTVLLKHNVHIQSLQITAELSQREYIYVTTSQIQKECPPGSFSVLPPNYIMRFLLFEGTNGDF